MSEFDAHVSQSAEADNANLLSFADFPVTYDMSCAYGKRQDGDLKSPL
jgi:hypothetical protein